MAADVLFVCVHNAGRSQMAKAFFNQLAQENGLELRADSAGTIAAERVHPEVVEVMQELALDVSGARPKLLSDDLLSGNPRVITMGCQVDAESCPALIMEDVVDWGLPDPAGRPLNEVRAIRDQIRQLVQALLQEIANANA
jgi:arsenate reductase